MTEPSQVHLAGKQAETLGVTEEELCRWDSGDRGGPLAAQPGEPGSHHQLTNSPQAGHHLLTLTTSKEILTGDTGFFLWLPNPGHEFFCYLSLEIPFWDLSTHASPPPALPMNPLSISGADQTFTITALSKPLAAPAGLQNQF